MPATAESSDVEIRRPMRGFGLRSGRIGPGQARALEVLGPRYLLPYSESPCDFGIAFGRKAPRIVEIGFGMGEAIAARARALPQADFIDIDVHSPGVGALLKRIGEFELTNLRVIQHDAVDVLRHMVAPETLAGVLLFFPDPWHKRRRHRRRLVQPAFVHLLASRLQRGGRLRCTTDWQPYAQQMLEVLSAEPLLRSAPCGFAERSTYRPPTNFEPRGLKLGHGVWDLVFVRR